MKLRLSIFVFLLSLTSFSQAQNFPESFVGQWKGDLEIYGVDKVNMKVEMNLNIKPTKIDSIYTWELIYVLNDSTTDVRQYELIIIDNSTGQYVIDEQNGIKIESYFLHHTFTSFFSVMDNFLVFSYTLVEDELIIDVFFSPQTPVSKTSGVKVNDEEIPIVTTYKVSGRQRGVLKKYN